MYALPWTCCSVCTNIWMFFTRKPSPFYYHSVTLRDIERIRQIVITMLWFDDALVLHECQLFLFWLEIIILSKFWVKFTHACLSTKFGEITHCNYFENVSSLNCLYWKKKIPPCIFCILDLANTIVNFCLWKYSEKLYIEATFQGKEWIGWN